MHTRSTGQIILVFRTATYGISTCFIHDPLTKGISKPLHVVFRMPYPWYIEPFYQWDVDPTPTHGISNHLTMIYRIPTDGILTLPPTHGISNPLPIVLWTSYTLYFETLFMVFRTATHSILNSLIHDILTSLQMVYRTLYTCYSEPMVYRTLLPMVFVSLPYPRNIEPIN